MHTRWHHSLALLLLAHVLSVLAAPFIDSFREIELPTSVEAEDYIDLSRLSDAELLRLERALQSRIREFEREQAAGFVEDALPIPMTAIEVPTDDDGLEEESPNDDEEEALAAAMAAHAQQAALRRLYRDRRAGGRHADPVLSESAAPGMALFPDEDGGTVIVLDDSLMPTEIAEDQPQFLLMPEPGDESFLPGQSDTLGQPRPVLLSADEVDELELRQRLAHLGAALSQRAQRAF